MLIIWYFVIHILVVHKFYLNLLNKKNFSSIDKNNKIDRSDVICLWPGFEHWFLHFYEWVYNRDCHFVHLPIKIRYTHLFVAASQSGWVTRALINQSIFFMSFCIYKLIQLLILSNTANLSFFEVATNLSISFTK